MKRFYSHFFEVVFEEISIGVGSIYKCELQDFSFTLCPAEIAQNTATQNRHQLDFQVKDLYSLLRTVETYGGRIFDQQLEKGKVVQAAVYDPDQNSIVLRQTKIIN